MQIFSFLREFSQLTPAQQRVFLYCAEKIPFPQAYTGDIQRIIIGTGLPRKTISTAFVAIAALPTLSRIVKYIHMDVSRPVVIPLHPGIVDSVALEGGGDGVGAFSAGVIPEQRKKASSKRKYNRSFPHSENEKC